jgi:hypothetical protein
MAKLAFRDYAPEKVAASYSDAIDNTNLPKMEDRLQRAEDNLKIARKNLATIREMAGKSVSESLSAKINVGAATDSNNLDPRELILFSHIMEVRRAENAVKVARKALDMPHAFLRMLHRKYSDAIFTDAFAPIDASDPAQVTRRNNAREMLANWHENMTRRSARIHNRPIADSADIRSILTGKLDEESATALFG